MDSEALERAQAAKRRDYDAAERFMKKYEGRCIRTTFANGDHVSEMVMMLQCYGGDLGKDWFKHTPRGMSTHDIFLHNAEVEAALQIPQQIIFGFSPKISQSVIDMIETELSILAMSH